MRVVLAGDPPRAVPDVGRRAGGRGVSVHASRRCLESALRTGALRRGLRAEPSATVDELALWAGGQYARRAAALLSVAVRSGKVVIGQERVREAMEARHVALLIVASDAGSGHQDLTRAAERLGGRCLVFGDKTSLGRLFGRELVAVIALTDPELAEQVRGAAVLAAELGEAAFDQASGPGETLSEELSEGS